MYKFCAIIDFAMAFAMIICMIYNIFMGMYNHDTYYLILGIIDYIAFQFNIKNIEYYIDNNNNI